jgi:hypothetical protein
MGSGDFLMIDLVTAALVCMAINPPYLLTQMNVDGIGYWVLDTGLKE